MEDSSIFHREIVSTYSHGHSKVRYKYYTHNHKLVTNPKLIEKLNEIKVPASYTDVILYPKNVKKLIAVANDGTGKKQYFYSKIHTENASRRKICNLLHLGKALPKIMADIDSLLRGRSGINQNMLDALALKVMIRCNFRVGCDSNLRKYETYGLTTLTTHHITYHSSNKSITIKFIGKKQQLNQCTINDARLVKLLLYLKKTHQREGGCDCGDSHQTTKQKNEVIHFLFRHKNGRVTPDSLNSFLANYHDTITTKIWRTWFANIEFIEKINQLPMPETKAARHKIVGQIIKDNSAELHHTAAIHKKNYLTKELPMLYIDSPDTWNKFQKKYKTAYSFLINFLRSYCQVYANKRT